MCSSDLWESRSLQSATREELVAFDIPVLFINSTTTLASNSTSRALIFRFKHMICPSLRAQSSAKKLVVIPIFLEKALIQAPESEQSTPSPLAASGFPSDESLGISSTLLRCCCHKVHIPTTKKQKKKTEEDIPRN